MIKFVSIHTDNGLKITNLIYFNYPSAVPTNPIFKIYPYKYQYDHLSVLSTLNSPIWLTLAD